MDQLGQRHRDKKQHWKDYLQLQQKSLVGLGRGATGGEDRDR